MAHQQQHQQAESEAQDIRHELKRARTILIKIGTEIVHSTDGVLAMGQIGAIVEQVSQMRAVCIACAHPCSF